MLHTVIETYQFGYRIQRYANLPPESPSPAEQKLHDWANKVIGIGLVTKGVIAIDNQVVRLTRTELPPVAKRLPMDTIALRLTRMPPVRCVNIIRRVNIFFTSNQPLMAVTGFPILLITFDQPLAAAITTALEYIREAVITLAQ